MARVFSLSIAILLIFLSLPITIYSAEDGLVSYWSLDDGKGDKTKDSGNSGNEGVINGKSLWVQGKAGTALSFAKADTIYVEVMDNPSLHITEQITMSAWIKPTSIYTGDDWKERNCVMAKRRAYYLDINEKGNLASYLYGVVPLEWLVGNTDMKKFLNKWVHVCTTYDGKEHKLFIDGKLDISVPKSGKITEVTDNFYIGWVDNNRYFDGTIDEVMLWSEALNADELIKSLSVDQYSKLASCWGILKTLQH